MSKAEDLANAHWEYVGGLLKFHIVNDFNLKEYEHLYITSFIHGYKHGIEDGNYACGGKCNDKKKKEPEFVPYDSKPPYTGPVEDIMPGKLMPIHPPKIT